MPSIVVKYFFSSDPADWLGRIHSLDKLAARAQRNWGIATSAPHGRECECGARLHTSNHLILILIRCVPRQTARESEANPMPVPELLHGHPRSTKPL